MNTHASTDSVIAKGPYSQDSRTAKRRKMQRGDHANAGIEPDAARRQRRSGLFQGSTEAGNR